MHDPLKSDPIQRNPIEAAWRKWVFIFVPLFAVTCAGIFWFGAGAIFPILIALLIVTLLYQRFVNRRSWRSIIWGVHAAEE